MANLSQADIQFDEARISLADGQVVIVVFADGTREVVNKMYRQRNPEPGWPPDKYVETQAGRCKDYADLHIFATVRDAQNFLFKKAA